MDQLNVWGRKAEKAQEEKGKEWRFEHSVVGL